MTHLIFKTLDKTFIKLPTVLCVGYISHMFIVSLLQLRFEKKKCQAYCICHFFVKAVSIFHRRKTFPPSYCYITNE